MKNYKPKSAMERQAMEDEPFRILKKADSKQESKKKLKDKTNKKVI